MSANNAKNRINNRSQSPLQKYLQRDFEILIDENLLAVEAFKSFYDNKLKKILKKAKKTILIPKDKVNTILNNRDKETYNYIATTYLSMQTYIQSDTRDFEELINSSKDSQYKPLLLLTYVSSNKTNAIKVSKNPRNKVLCFSLKTTNFYEFKQNQTKHDQSKAQGKMVSNESKLKISHVPKENDRVYYKIKNNKQSLQLVGDCLSSGGEGKIYNTNSSALAKIYQIKNNKESSVPDYTPEKLLELCAVKLNSQYKKFVCLPQYVLYNDKDECVGFLMQKAQGFPIQYIFGGTKSRQKYVGGWGLKHYIILCIKFLQILESLHKKKILVGDINPQNFMINETIEIYFIDCDSYQVTNKKNDTYPCPVATEEFLHPSYHGKSMNKTIRSLADEYWAIAIMLFKILAYGRSPYDSKQSQRDENAKQMRFPYRLDGLDPDRLIPNDNAKKLWDRLPNKIKQAFFHTFQKGGKYADPKKILKPKQWLKIMQDSLKAMP